MGIKDALVSMMGDFVELRRNPDFRSKNELSSVGADQQPSEHAPMANPNRRHSLQITCGTVQDAQPELLVHQRTFSVKNGQKDSIDSVSLRQEPPPLLLVSRYNQRRASEPVNLLGIGPLGWARASGGGQKQKQRREQKAQPPSPSSSEYADPCAAPPPPSASPSASSLSKSANFGRSFFAHQNPIEEAEEIEAEMEGQRRQSQGKQQQAATVIRL